MNLINRIIAASAIVVAVFTPLALAQRMRGGGGGFGGGGEFGGGGGRGGPYGGGGGGGGRNSTVAFISTVCDGVTPTTCELPPCRDGGGSSNGTVAPTSGIFVCRTRTNPNNLEVNTFSMCIPEDKGIVGDECGCCDDVCPEPREFPSDPLDRDGNPNVDANGDAIVGGGYGGGASDVGRGGPFGCGRNSTVEFVSNICEGHTPTTCDLPPRGGEGGGYPSEESAVVSTSGIFVCRTRTNPNTQEVDAFSMCIPEDKGIAGDECGCCDDVCPEPCECPCDIVDGDGNPKVDANGDAILGALVTIEGMDDDKCVPASASAYMVERSNGAVTCAACE